MNLIAAVTSDWGIGRNGKLLLSVPEDMRFFREKTKGAVVLMGRSTLESFPGGKPLAGRTNIVLTRNPCYSKDGVIIVNDINEALSVLSEYEDDNIYVIGGGQIYSLFLPYCKKAYITKLDVILPADTYFPDLDELDNWVLTEQSDSFCHADVQYSFAVYENLSVKSVMQ